MRLYKEKESLKKEIKEKLREKRERGRITVAPVFTNTEFNNNLSPWKMISSSFISISVFIYRGNPY